MSSVGRDERLDFSYKGTVSQFQDSMRCDALEDFSNDESIALAQV